jgi:hypothetical protein
MPEQLQPLLFGEDFIDDHAGRLIHNPDIALVELVANAWDAGASQVQITWPLNHEDEVAVEDNGTGMTRDEFFFRWNHIKYNRLSHQGNQAQFPPDIPTKKRRAYGCNGKGRHSMFCFNDEYYVETWRDGKSHIFSVHRSSGEKPWEISEKQSFDKQGHGTRVYTTAIRGMKALLEVRQLIGSKFIADPEFVVSVNGQSVEFEEVTARLPHHKIDVPDFGEIEIVKIQAEKGRTAKQHGLAWWVNRRLVGDPGWETFDEHLLDGRKALAKSMTFVVLADILEPVEDLTADWSAFLPNKRTMAVHKAVAAFVRTSIQDELKGERKERKREILLQNRQTIRNLSPISQKVVASFIDEVQIRCPTLKDQDLENAASLLINLENAQSGYALIEQLSQLQADDLDGWNKIMAEWTIDGARKVLGELKWRLQLIAQLEGRVEKKDVDELHELQPLFEKGLWIFGPEYEAIEFRSNRTIGTIIKDFFGNAVVENPRIRPDFVALPDASLGAYACNSYDENGEVSGYGKVAIVELKRGGFEITGDEMNQANKYAYAISNSGRVQEGTQIICFVLGAKLRFDAQKERKEGNIRIIPRPYNVVLRQAHSRTFNLLEKIKEIPTVNIEDDELTSVLKAPEQMKMFETVGVPSGPE